MEAAKKILLVEDNPGDARLLREALREFDHAPPFELAHVERLEEGISGLKQERFEAVLLDLSLPDARGVDTVVRMQREIGSVPIVVLTGLDDDTTALEAVRAGAQDYLIKGQIDGRLLVRALSYAIERKRLQEATQRHLDRITALKDINTALTSTLDLAAVLETLLEKVRCLMPDFTATVGLWNEESLILEPVACGSIDEAEWQAETARRQEGCGLADVAFQTKGLLMVPNVQNDPRMLDAEFCRQHGLSAYLGIPLIVNDRVLGVLSFYGKMEHEFSSQEIDFLSALATQASVAIHNSQVHGEMKKLAGGLERANRIKEEFLSVMSHELRTPLNVVAGYVEMLQRGLFGQLNWEQEEALEKVAKQTTVQLAMVNSILHATAIESEVVVVQSEKVSVCEFLDEMRAAYPAPLDRRITLLWQYSADLPVLRTDKTKVKYILQNLINNAVKFTSEGEVRVSAKVLASPTLSAGGLGSTGGKIWLMLEVADTGVGIAEEFLPVIFEKFSQVDSSTTRVHDGIGLGLHIVKRCTELLKGTIKVDSEPGKGSTFTVTIPCETERQTPTALDNDGGIWGSGSI